jgi:hypothetical protein
MITNELASRLRAAGIVWTPANGDRFVVPGRDLDDQVFVVSDMVIESHDVPGGRVIRFNGTTEWALDSIPADLALWLPREDQLRGLLAERFVRLEAVGDGLVVVLADGSRHADTDAERAYARAVLHTLGE